MARRGFVGWTPETERAARPAPLFLGIDLGRIADMTVQYRIPRRNPVAPATVWDAAERPTITWDTLGSAQLRAYGAALRRDWIPAAPIMTPMDRRTQLISHDEAEQRQINDYLSRGYKVLFDLRTEEGARAYHWESRLRSIKRLLYVKEDVETSALLSVGYWVTER